MSGNPDCHTRGEFYRDTRLDMQLPGIKSTGKKEGSELQANSCTYHVVAACLAAVTVIPAVSSADGVDYSKARARGVEDSRLASWGWGEDARSAVASTGAGALTSDVLTELEKDGWLCVFISFKNFGEELR